VEFRALTHADEVEVLDVSFPPRVTNTLEWRIHSEYAGEVQVEIRYFTSGISWAADYVVEADKAEKVMALAGQVRVTNNSGEDYDNAHTSYYKFEREQWGEQVMRYYRFTNSVTRKLGQEPLPDGAVHAFRLATEDNLYAFVGRTRVKYIPVNETVELELGANQEVLVKPTLMNWDKSALSYDEHGDVKGWTIRENWQVEGQNSKAIPVMLDIRRNFTGDWSLSTVTLYEKVDANKVKFVLPLQPHEKWPFSYAVTTHYGADVTR
jgi:hypothetical protein